MSLFATKPISAIIAEAEETGTHTFKKTLTALDLTMLGIGAIIGTGIFVLTGQAAGKHGWSRRDHLDGHRRYRQRLCGSLLFGICGQRSDLRFRLRLRLRDARRIRRVDNRLGPDPRICFRCCDGCCWLVRVMIVSLFSGHSGYSISR